MSRPARVCIDTDALRHNYRHLRTLHGGRVLAVLKANAYGRGAEQCAGALAELADGFQRPCCNAPFSGSRRVSRHWSASVRN